MRRKKITYTDLLIQSSGEYLTDNFPANFDDMTEEAVNEFIEEHIIEAYEYRDVGDVWGMIDCGAYALADFLKNKGINVIRE